MDKGKTTKIISGGVRIGKDGKPHKWSKIHGYKTQKVTDDNWMDYGMPDDEPDTRKIKNESRNMNRKLIKLTESDIHKIVKESVNRVLKEGVEFSSEDPQEEWMYYQNKLQQEFDELGVMVLNKIPRNDPDRQIIQRYIRMIQTHLHTLEN